jgi:hypothetical protein
MVAVVGAAEAAQEGTVHIAERAAPVGEGDALGPVFVFHLFQFVGDVVEGLVPTDLAPLALSPGADTDHRHLGPFRVGDQGISGRTPRADRPLHRRDMGIALKKRHLAVLDRNLDRTPNCTHSAYTEH